ncbi:MAG: hypothetical protein KN64_11405 [Sulfurovum sp. AS07-7]|nr:MAG: hypothetical protein KN64_11405 [Sulfurovum sp. AS07-7]
MYCILNQSNDLVASDLEFLKLFDTNSLVDLYKKISIGSAKISLNYNKITITLNDDVKMYDIKVTPLATLFGKSVLVEPVTPLANRIIENSYFSTTTISKQESTAASKEIQTQNIKPKEVAKEEAAQQPKIEIQAITQKPKAENISTTDSKEEEQKKSAKKDQEYFINHPVTLNISEIAQSMHLSEGDYRAFLNEYISSIDKFKNDLLGDNTEIKDNALNFIKHLTTALYLPKEIENLVGSLKADSSKELFQNFFDIIDNIKEQNELFLTPVAENEAEVESNAVAVKEEAEVRPVEIDENIISLDITENKEQLPEIQVEPIQNPVSSKKTDTEMIELEILDNIISEPIKENKNSQENESAKIDLSNIKPIPFDFILDESANELSLPVDIVKEFIKDFIEQCHADTDKIIQKYKEGDIEKVKKLAHSLKGVASNLYIMPLADTLLQLQYNDDLVQVKPLVEKYWGQFLYLENLMKNI